MSLEYQFLGSSESLIKNGNFSEGLAHWFGSFLKHSSSSTLQSTSANAPSNVVRMLSSQTATDFPEGIPQGLNQFVDRSDLYSYPSLRRVNNLVMRPIGDGIALLYLQINTEVDGIQLTAGVENAPDFSLYFQHPFYYRDATHSVSIESGSVLALEDLTKTTQTDEYRAGRLILDYTGVDAVTEPHKITDHYLEVRPAEATFTPLMSEANFTAVTTTYTFLESTGVGVIQFIGEGFDTIITFPRGDGSVGPQIGDTFVTRNPRRAGRIIGVGTSNGADSFNISYKNIPGIPTFTEGGDATEWELYTPSQVNVDREMPLCQYSFTLGTTYDVALGAPSPSVINFRTFEADGSIIGLGTIGDIVPRITSLSRSLVLATKDVQNNNVVTDDARLQRAQEYFFRESAEPLTGRMLLNVPPVGASVEGSDDTATVTLLHYDEVNNKLEITYTIAAVGEHAITDVTYKKNDPTYFNNETLTFGLSTSPGGFASLGTQIYITGDIDPALDPDDWLLQNIAAASFATTNISLNEPIVLTTGLVLPFAGGTVNVITFSVPNTLRLSVNEPPTPFSTAVADVLVLKGVAEGFTDIVVDRPLTVESDTYISTDASGDFITRTMVVNWPSTATGALTDVDTSDNAVTIAQAINVSSGNSSDVGDIALHKGNRLQSQPVSEFLDINNQVASTSESPSINRVPALTSIIPSSAVILYAGGGACPPGYKRLETVAGLGTFDLGLGSLYKIAKPDTIVYDATTDKSTLTWLNPAFDIPAADGGGTNAGTGSTVNVSVNGGLVSFEVAAPRQVLEPGAQIKVRDFEYTTGDSTLVDDTFSIQTPLNWQAPYEDLFRSWVVTNSSSVVDEPLLIQDTAKPTLEVFEAPIADGSASRSTYGDGLGSIDYPGITQALNFDWVNFSETTPGVPPMGPPPGTGDSQQNNVFPGANPLAFFVVQALESANGITNSRLRTVALIGNVHVGGAGVTTASITDPLSDPSNFNVEVSTNAYNSLSPPNRPVSGDVYYASVYAYERVSNNPEFRLQNRALVVPVYGGLNQDNEEVWYFYRYDKRRWPLFGLSSPITNWSPSDTQGGNSSLLGNGFIALRPAKFYGAAGIRQKFDTVTNVRYGGTNSIPTAVGSNTFQKVAGNPTGSNDLWVTAILPVTLTVTTAGQFEMPSNSIECLLEPTGYLKYGDPLTGIDYGAGGHNHSLSATSVTADLALPRVDNQPAATGTFAGSFLGSNHTHGSLQSFRYPLPAAKFFTLCMKL